MLPRSLFLVVLIAMSMLGNGTVAADQATPSSGAGARHSFSGLNLPELRVTVEDSGIDVVQDVQSGPMVLIVTNRTAEPVLITPMQVADDDTIDDLKLAELMLPTLPPAFHRAIWAGGATALPDQTTQGVVVMLTPGQWYMYSWAAPTPDPIPFTVTDTVASAAEVPSDAAPSIEMKDFQFVLPERIEAGTTIWKVMNTGEQVHDIHILKVPDGTTPETIRHVFFPESGSTPPANLPSPEEFVPYAGLAPLSQGQAFWTEITLDAGTYMMVTWFAERDTGTLQLELGMMSVFEVVAPGGVGNAPASPEPLQGT